MIIVKDLWLAILHLSKIGGDDCLRILRHLAWKWTALMRYGPPDVPPIYHNILMPTEDRLTAIRTQVKISTMFAKAAVTVFTRATKNGDIWDVVWNEFAQLSVCPIVRFCILFAIYQGHFLVLRRRCTDCFCRSGKKAEIVLVHSSAPTASASCMDRSIARRSSGYQC